jgi:hypothetical protein
LLRRHGDEWAGPLRDWATAWEFRRGLLETIELAGEDLAAHANDIASAFPVRTVKFGWRDPGAVVAALRDCPGLDRLGRFDFVFDAWFCQDADLEVLASLPPVLFGWTRSG